MKHKVIPPIILFSTLVFQLFVRLEILESGYNIERLRSQALKSDSEIRNLKLDRAYLVNPRRLQSNAKRLELDFLKPQQIRRVN